MCRMSVRIHAIESNASRACRRPGDTLPLMGGAYTLLALVVVLLLTAAEFGFALYAFRSSPPLVLPVTRTLSARGPFSPRNDSLCMTLSMLRAPSSVPNSPCTAPRRPVAPHPPPASIPRPSLQRHPKSGAAGDPILLHVQDCLPHTQLVGIHVDERLDVARHQL